MRTPSKATFAQIVESSRWRCARAAWERAESASRLRYVALGQGRRRAARRLATLKLGALERVCAIAPERVTVTIDRDRYFGQCSLRLRGAGRLHVAVGAEQRILGLVGG